MAKSAVIRDMEQVRRETSPLSIPRSHRVHEVKSFTSLPAGKVVPLAAVPLLREDAVRRGNISFAFEMHETAEIIMNGVLVRVQAHLVPWLVFDRFKGSMDLFNKSYAGEPLEEGDEVVPFFETLNFAAGSDPAVNPVASDEILKYLGLHTRPGLSINTMYRESYNQIWNHRATNVSKQLNLRNRLADKLAPAFWIHQNYRHIVPDYDQALIEGDVPISFLEGGTVPVYSQNRGIHANNALAYPVGAQSGTRYEADKGAWSFGEEVFVELEERGVSVSLANIQLARTTAAFARARRRYSGHDDDYIINLLMDGIRIPDEQYKHPIKVGQKTAVFGMAKRYATDGESLNESVVNGMASVSMSVNIPRLNTGGILMFTAEIMPEQLFERQKDPFVYLTDVEELPEFMRDHLDPEPVEVVSNDYVDVDHATPSSAFGYMPLNAQWNIVGPRVGGRYYRPKVNTTTDQDRQRLWSVETENPVLGKNFYLCSDIHIKPFVDRTTDPFEAVILGGFSIEGNTVFGPPLVENNGEYEDVGDRVPPAFETELKAAESATDTTTTTDETTTTTTTS